MSFVQHSKQFVNHTAAFLNSTLMFFKWVFEMFFSSFFFLRKDFFVSWLIDSAWWIFALVIFLSIQVVLIQLASWTGVSALPSLLGNASSSSELANSAANSLSIYYIFAVAVIILSSLLLIFAYSLSRSFIWSRIVNVPFNMKSLGRFFLHSLIWFTGWFLLFYLVYKSSSVFVSLIFPIILAFLFLHFTLHAHRSLARTQTVTASIAHSFSEGIRVFPKSFIFYLLSAMILWLWSIISGRFIIFLLNFLAPALPLFLPPQRLIVFLVFIFVLSPVSTWFKFLMERYALAIPIAKPVAKIHNAVKIHHAVKNGGS